MQSKKNQGKTKVEVKTSSTFPTTKIERPISTIALKLLIIAVFFFLLILYFDSKGLFNADNTNNHTVRKWDTYYDFAKNYGVDVLLIGNSHLYTGVNPENLSNALGCSAFILASPGTGPADHYFALQEAIQVSKPKLVIVETYGLKGIEQMKLKGSALSDQFKSFSARKNLQLKLASTPSIFSLSNYPYAWSSTLRNHDFLLSNYDQIKRNVQLSKQPKAKNDQLYLGRFVRFTSGIEDTLLVRYERKGAPVDGSKYQINEESTEYIHKMISLCERNNIKLIFLTVPMYEKHISNYSVWKERLGKALGNYSSDSLWLDLQTGKGYEHFSTDCFENTYGINQHLTYNGSLLASYKIVNFIKAHNINVPDKRNDATWRNIFYGSDGFFENSTPDPRDPYNVVIYRGSENEIFQEALLLKRKDFFGIEIKIKPQNYAHYEQLLLKKIVLTVEIKNQNGQLQTVPLELTADLYHSSIERMNFSTNIRPVEINRIVNFEVVD